MRKVLSSALAVLLGTAGLAVTAGTASAHNTADAHHPVASIQVSPAAEVALGSNLTATSVITDQHEAGYYSVGTVTLQYKTGGPLYTTFASGTPSGASGFQGILAVTEANGFAVGQTINVRARYDHPTFDDDDSAVVEVAVVEAECTPGFHISEPSVTGTGTPGPGSNNSWTFDIAVKNCTGQDLTGVKVQGGTSGWTTLVGSPSVTEGDVTSVKTNKKGTTAVTTWIVDLLDGQEETISITVNGSIPNRTPCDDGDNLDIAPATGELETGDPEVDGYARYLSGGWSASYTLSDGGEPPVLTPMKTDHTDRAFVVVTCA